MFPEPPKIDEEHLVADYVEFCCLLTLDGFFSTSEGEADRVREEDLDPTLLDRVEPRDAAVRILAGSLVHDAPEITVLAALGRAESDEATQSTSPLPRASGEEPTGALADDARAVLTQDVIQHLVFRAELFGDRYPFQVDAATGSLRLRKLTPRRRLYVFLLAASSLRHFSKRDSQALTRAFERLAVPVMRAHMPGAQVHLFGTSSKGHRGRYRGQLSKKVQRLATDLRISLEVDLSAIKPTNVGDQGIDAVVWFETGDRSRSVVAVFVQCACSVDEWPRKSGEVAEDAFAYWFHFYSPITNLLMIPFCFRRLDGDWFDTTKMKKGVLFDRSRILLSLRGGGLASAGRVLPTAVLGRKFTHFNADTSAAVP